MAGNQSRGLIAASKTKGWDPTVIPGVGSIADFDVDMGNLPGDRVGRISGGPPAPVTPEASDPVFTERVSFNAPDVSRENKNRATRGADPFAGMGGE